MYVTLASFSNPLNAHILCGKLQAEGVECHLADEHIVTANWLYANAVGGVKLRVRREQADRALLILEKVAPPGADGAAEGCRDNQAEASGESRACPQCRSKNVHFERFARRWVFLSWLLLGFPLPFLRRTWTCDDCDHRWKR
jgi:hypothetical protein